MSGPGGEGGLVGSQVGDQGCDLLRRAQPPHGLPLYELLLGSDRVLALINPSMPGGSLHGAGTDGIAADLKQERFEGHKEGGELFSPTLRSTRSAARLLVSPITAAFEVP